MTEQENILSKATGIDVRNLEYQHELERIRPSEAWEAMQETAIRFAEWLRINQWAFAINSGDDWVRINEENELVFKTSEELFKIFNTQTNE
jgi:hypothetical protein